MMPASKLGRLALRLAAIALVAALAASGAEADEKKKKKKKKKQEQQTEATTSTESAGTSGSQPPRVVRDIERRLMAYDTRGARELLAGQEPGGNVHLLIAEGRCLHLEKQYQQAAQRLTTAANQAPTNPAPLVYLGETYLHADDRGAASTAFAQAEQRATAWLQSEPQNADALYFLGVAQQRQQKYDAAFQNLEMARQQRPDDAEILYRLGLTRAFQQNWQGSVDLLNQALERNNGLAYAYYYRALSNEKLGRKDLLVNDLHRFLDMAPQAPEAEKARRILSGL